MTKKTKEDLDLGWLRNHIRESQDKKFLQEFLQLQQLQQDQNDMYEAGFITQPYPALPEPKPKPPLAEAAQLPDGLIWPKPRRVAFSLFEIDSTPIAKGKLITGSKFDQYAPFQLNTRTVISGHHVLRHLLFRHVRSLLANLGSTLNHGGSEGFLKNAQFVTSKGSHHETPLKIYYGEYPEPLSSRNQTPWIGLQAYGARPSARTAGLSVRLLGENDEGYLLEVSPRSIEGVSGTPFDLFVRN